MTQDRKIRSLTVLAVALALTLGSLTAMAAERPGAPPPKGVEGLLRCLRVVDLTEAQKVEVKAILDAERDVLKGLFDALKTDQQALRAAMTADPKEPCTVGAALIEVDASNDAIRAELEKIRTNVAALLTPEQKAKLAGCLAVVGPRAAEDGSETE